MKVGNLIVKEEGGEVLVRLKEYLQSLGISRFASFKYTNGNIMFPCPIHKDGQEEKPSAGMTLGSEGGVIHCFTCGYTSNIAKMISDILEKKDQGKFGIGWLKSNFEYEEYSSREIKVNLSRDKKEKRLNFINEQELECYRYMHPYMENRKISEEMAELYDVGYDRKSKSLTFPVRDLKGRVLYIIRRSVNYKFFNIPENEDKELYGAYEFKEYFPDIREIVICESCINAITSTRYGRPAVALIGRFISPRQIETLKKLNVRKVVLGLDGDVWGREATYKIGKTLQKHKFLVSFLDLPDGKDINDLNKKDFKKLNEILLT